MKQPVFTGSCVAIVTPFTSDGSQVNFPKLAQLIDWQIESGTDAICICGTTGESATQTMEEHMETVEFCVKHVNGRVKVVAGSGSNDTQAALILAQHAESVGADGLLMVTPYYNKATQRGLIRHYEYLADRVHTPIILYNVPSRTGIGFTAETYQVLSQHPNINGVKEASGDLGLVTRIRATCGDDFYIWSGNDGQTVPLMVLGAMGVISVTANVLPQLMAKMSHLCLEGSFQEAARLQIQSDRLNSDLFLEVNPIPVKEAMNMMGLEVGPLRLPLCELTDAHRETLRQTLLDAGIALV